MMSVTSACQIPVEEEEEDEDDEILGAGCNELLRAYPNRQVSKRCRFTLYEKMADVHQIQRNRGCQFSFTFRFYVFVLKNNFRKTKSDWLTPKKLF